MPGSGSLWTIGANWVAGLYRDFYLYIDAVWCSKTVSWLTEKRWATSISILILYVIYIYPCMSKVELDWIGNSYKPFSNCSEESRLNSAILYPSNLFKFINRINFRTRFGYSPKLFCLGWAIEWVIGVFVGLGDASTNKPGTSDPIFAPNWMV